MSANGTRILVVEDNGDDMLILERLFARMGSHYQVEGAQTGADALARVQSQTWDLAFIDQHLPDVRGEALIGQIRQVEPHLPVIMLTGQGDEQLAVSVMKAGAWDYLRKNDLNGPLLRRTLHSIEERARLDAQVRATQAELRELAIRDGLTGLCNHRHFQSLLQTEFARARRYGKPLACLMLDLDRFKRINDTLGHPCGDEVLRHVSQLLRGVAREVDVLARYGGEEFVLLLPNTDAEGAMRAGERICEAVAESRVELADRQLRLTVSVGAATDESPGVASAVELVRRADEALYAAKRGGRNRVCLAGTPEALVDEVPSGAGRSGRRTAVVLTTLSSMVERHHPGRAGHGARVAALVGRLVRSCGLGHDVQEATVAAARLAGLGRLALPESFWNTPHALDDAGLRRVRESALLAEEILLQAGEREAVATAVRHQRERWDGRGAPDGLRANEIPIGSRALAVVDAWCALTAERPWRSAYSPEEARQIVVAEAGKAFDPRMVKALCALFDAEGVGP